MPKATAQYSLHIVNPGLAKEWHPTRNGDLNPRNVTPGSGKKVWWICRDGHEWEAAIYSRNRGSGCPSCNKPTLADDHDMLISNTGLVKEWHLTKNSGLNLRNLPPGNAVPFLRKGRTRPRRISAGFVSWQHLQTPVLFM